MTTVSASWQVPDNGRNEKAGAYFLADGATCGALLSSTHRSVQTRQDATVSWSPCNFFPCTLSGPSVHGTVVELERWIGSFRLHCTSRSRCDGAMVHILSHWKQARVSGCRARRPGHVTNPEVKSRYYITVLQILNTSKKISLYTLNISKPYILFNRIS